LQLELFDAEYVRRLAAGDPTTESQFSEYFVRFLSLKLRARRISPEIAEDVRQETLFRVLKILRQGAGVARPEAFGAFVNSVCNIVLKEWLRKSTRECPGTELEVELPDQAMDVETSLIDQERKKLVSAVLDELPPRDREIMRLVFFEQLNREDICARLRVEPVYMRVLLHRAKERFQKLYKRKRGAVTHLLLFFVT
jgi:RNA polymerase sigma factor (sigma-70 family)